jgi:hypothetical protein
VESPPSDTCVPCAHPIRVMVTHPSRMFRHVSVSTQTECGTHIASSPLPDLCTHACCSAPQPHTATFRKHTAKRTPSRGVCAQSISPYHSSLILFSRPWRWVSILQQSAELREERTHSPGLCVSERIEILRGRGTRLNVVDRVAECYKHTCDDGQAYHR